LVGGAGDDLLYGGQGSDTYFFEIGFGHDRILNDDIDPFGVNVDIIKFGEGINPNDLSISQVSHAGQISLLLSSINGGSSLSIDRYFENDANSNYAVERIKFFNGVEWDVDYIKSSVLNSTGANDFLHGFATGDVVKGGAGNDEIYTYGGNDFIEGESGSDLLRGGTGSDTLKGGTGNDNLSGDDGADIYQFDVGSGQDTMHFYQNDTLRFGAGIYSHQIEFLNINNNYIVLKVNNQGDSIVMFDTPSLAEIQFDNGQVWNSQSIRDRISTASFVEGGIVIGTASGDILNGGFGDDTVSGSAGNDTIDGGFGNDSLDGGIGNDIYIFGKGSGHDVINSNDNTANKIDTIKIEEGLLPSDILARRSGADLILIAHDSIASLMIKNYFRNDGTSGYKIENIYFSSGDVWDIAAVKSMVLVPTERDDTIYGYAVNEVISAGLGADSIYAGSGDDILDGGAGSDVLDGGVGGDIFNFGRGYGSDTIEGVWDKVGVKPDVLQLGDGIVIDDLSFVHFRGEGLIISIKGTQDKISIYNYFSDGVITNRVDLVRFFDGTTLTFDQIRLMTNIGTNANDLLYTNSDTSLIGFDGNDDLYSEGGLSSLLGGDGDDALHTNGNNLLDGGAGIDLLKNEYTDGIDNNIHIGGLGDDVISDQGGHDTYRFNLGDGFDKVVDSSGIDTLEFGIGITQDDIIFTNEHGGVVVTFKHSPYDKIQFSGWNLDSRASYLDGKIETVKFFDDTSISFDDAPLLDETIPWVTPLEIRSDASWLYVGGRAEQSAAVFIHDSDGFQVGAGNTDTVHGYFNITLDKVYLTGEDLFLSVRDAAGNTSAPQIVKTPDKTAPTAPTASFDEVGKVITGVAEAGSTVSVKNAGGTVLKTATANATTGAYTITLTTALINKEAVSVTAKDAAGNVSAVTPLIAPDKTAPSIPTASFDAAGLIISGVAEMGSTVIVKNASGVELKTAIANAATGAYSITLTTALINKETVNVTARDAAGNISSIKAINAPDKTAPTIPTASFDPTGKIITGVAEAGSTVSVTNAGGTVLKTAVANATTGAYTITLTTALINKETVNVTAKDTAGNISAIRAIIAPDKTAPTIPTASFDPTGKIITGVAEAGSTVSIKNAAGTELKTAIANATTGAYTITLTTALINKETVNVTAKDAAGNISAIKAIVAPDKTAPLAPTASIDTSRKIITGTAEPGSVVEVKNTAGTKLGQFTAHATTGAYTITLGTALAINQTVNVTAKDAAGNVSPIRPAVAPAMANKMLARPQFANNLGILETVAAYASEKASLAAFGNHTETVIASATSDSFAATLPDNRDRYISGNVDINALIQAMASFEPAVGVDIRNRIASVDQHQVILATSS
jgi:Ca2+-binding RTX toxin-like protein